MTADEAQSVFDKHAGKHPLSQSILIERGLKLELGGYRDKNLEESLYAFPVVKAGMFRGMLLINSKSDQSTYVDYNDVVAYTEKRKNSVSCGDAAIRIVGLMHNLAVYQFQSIPNESLSRYIENALSLECQALTKCDIVYEESYQYVAYEDGVPSAIVSGTYVVKDCSNGPSDDEGDNPAGGDEDDYSFGNGGNSNRDDDERGNDPDEEELATNIRNWLVDNCGFKFGTGEDIGRLNAGTGHAFEQTILSILGLPQNKRMFRSADRLAHSRNNHLHVQPDAVIPAIEVEVESRSGVLADINVDVHTCFDCAFVEVKAYTTNINLSTSDHQIRGMIDAVKNTHKGQNMPNDFTPALFIYTLGGDISQGVTDYASRNKVQLFLGSAVFREDGDIYLKGYNMKNHTTPAVFPTTTGTAPLKCPPFSPSNRLDPEIYNG